MAFRWLVLTNFVLLLFVPLASANLPTFPDWIYKSSVISIEPGFKVGDVTINFFYFVPASRTGQHSGKAIVGTLNKAMEATEYEMQASYSSVGDHEMRAEVSYRHQKFQLVLRKDRSVSVYKNKKRLGGRRLLTPIRGTDTVHLDPSGGNPLDQKYIKVEPPLPITTYDGEKVSASILHFGPYTRFYPHSDLWFGNMDKDGNFVPVEHHQTWDYGDHSFIYSGSRQEGEVAISFDNYGNMTFFGKNGISYERETTGMKPKLVKTVYRPLPDFESPCKKSLSRKRRRG